MIKSERVAEVMLGVDRAEFCQNRPYLDTPSPIGYNATISAPHMHAFALEESMANLKAGKGKVLDVGSGSGYLTVCYGEIVKSINGKVIGLEHIDGLVEDAIRNARKSHGHLLDDGVVKFVVGDGRSGYPAEAPYDVIHVGAACEQAPPALMEQLAPGGIIIIPVGDRNFQTIKIIERDREGRTSVRESFNVRYVPLTDKSDQLKGVL